MLEYVFKPMIIHMKNIFSILFFAALFFNGLGAQSGYELTFDIEGYEQDTLMLAYYYGDKQYLKDTAVVNDQGTFVFSDQEPLEGGTYLVVMKPENDFFQVLVNDTEQRFRMETKRQDPTGNMKIHGSEDNKLFYEYVNFLSGQRKKLDAYNKEKESAGESGATAVEAKIDKLNQEVSAFQKKLVADHPESLTAAIVKANFAVDIPEFTGTPEEVNLAKWRYMQAHYFDNLDLGDPRLLRTSFLFQRIDYFVNKLQVQHPDSLSKAIDEVLTRAKPSEETFKYYLIHFLNTFAKSKIVGMDAVYVHLVENYYATGQADWTDPDQLEKILENAKTLKPLLIGKKAPNIRMQDRANKPVALHDVDADYTVLYFWRYDCGHCKESTPVIKEFYEKFKDKGVKIMAICSKYTDEVPACWDYIDENEIGDWLHTVDPYNRSKYGAIYNIKTTPQIYVLDRDKVIQFKQVGAEQLEEILNHLIEQEESGATGR